MKSVPHPRTLVDMVTGWLWSFHPRSIPPMQRMNYARELLSWAFLPIMLGAIEGGTMAVIVKKAWTGVPGVSPAVLDFAVALVSAAPNFANLTSFLWARVSHGRDKVRFISKIQIATCICVAVVAAMPVSAWGLLGTCIAVLVARATWTGVITVRTAVWRQNYPKANRASIAGKMATMQSLMLALSGWVVGASMDISAVSFHCVFPVLAVVGLYGNSIFRKVRLRGGRGLARAERSQGGGRAKLTANPVDGAQMAGEAFRTNWRVLVEDREYRRFMVWMFVFGLGNLMVLAPQALVLEDELGATYLQAILATTVIPLAIMPLAIPVWAKLLDRVHIVRFRSIHAWSFVLAALMLWIAAVGHQLWLFYVASVFLGVGFAGGSLAWNLGHHDFAPPQHDALYMSVHVTLNGIRGVIAPFVAVGLYKWLGGHGMASWTFFICFLVNTLGAMGFVWHWRDMRRAEAARAAADGTAGESGFRRAVRVAEDDAQAPQAQLRGTNDLGG